MSASSRYFVIGAGGNVGSHVVRRLSSMGHDVVAVCRNRLPLACFDAKVQHCLVDGSIESLLATLDTVDVRESFVLHFAAVTNVADAHRDPVSCLEVNVRLPEALAAFCAARNATMIYFSTDMVFNGEPSSSNGYGEGDTPGPLSVYGMSKLEGEAAVSKHGAFVVRLPLMFGAPDRADAWASPFGSVVDGCRAAVPRPLTGFADELRSPLSYGCAAALICAWCLKLQELSADRPPVVHLAGLRRSSRYELQVAIASAESPSTSRVEVTATSQAAYNASASEPRPRDLCLSVALAATTLGNDLYARLAPKSLDEQVVGALRHLESIPKEPPQWQPEL